MDAFDSLGFLGAGKMGEALMAGALRGGVAAPASVFACDVAEARRADLAARYGIETTADPAFVAARCNTLVLAVKPQDLEALLRTVSPLLTSEHLVFSIAAGKRLEWLEALAPRSRLVRVMPNLPVQVGAGMCAYCPGARATETDCAAAERLLGCSGRVVRLEESCFDAVTALSGSGPAFFAKVMMDMASSAVAEGLPEDAARLLALQTMFGTARYLLETGQDPAAFIQAVASPKGTTAAGLDVMSESDLAEVLGRTIRAAARRSRELSL
ncbi:MAG: pyrroline-5-carboxylate reductase [Kiritimatiellia bacterium]|jgi:pyrroline-5-carboxylate reductase